MGRSKCVRTSVAVMVVLALSVVGGVGPTSIAADPSTDPTRFTGSNFWQTPDDPSLDITGPIDIRVAVRMDDWTPPSNGNGTRVTFVSKWGNTDGAWGLQLITSDDGSFPNRLLMIWDDETGGISSRSVVGPTVGAADGTFLGIRATLEPAILRVRFFSKPTTEATALADIGSDTGWSQLGSDITGAASPPINSTSDPVTIGTLRPQDAVLRLYDANIYAVVVKNGVNGTTVLDPDLGAQPDGETNFTDGAGRSWTEKGHVAHRWRADGNAQDSIGTNHGALQGNASAAGTPAAEGTSAFSFDGNDDDVAMPSVSTHYFSGSFTVEASVKTSASNGMIVSKYECGGSLCPANATTSYQLYVDATGAPALDVRDSAALAGQTGQTINGPSSIATNAYKRVRGVRDVSSGLLAIYVDGTLVALAALESDADGPLAEEDGEDDALTIGALIGSTANPGILFDFNGLIDDVQLSAEGAVDPADFDPTLTDTVPDSPANDTNPKIKGNAIAGSTVDLYTNSNCTGSSVANGDAADFASSGLPVTVDEGSTTTFFATATVGSAVSDCSSSSITYTDQTPPQFRADEHIKRSKDATFLGDDTHNTTAAGQTVQSKTKRGKKAVFNIVVQNDGTDPDAFTVSGCKKSRGFKVSYLDGATNVTSQVTTTGFTTPTLAPGGTRALLLTVKVKSAGPKKKTCAVTATSQGNSSQDVVVGKVKAKG